MTPRKPRPEDILLAAARSAVPTVQLAKGGGVADAIKRAALIRAHREIMRQKRRRNRGVINRRHDEFHL